MLQPLKQTVTARAHHIAQNMNNNQDSPKPSCKTYLIENNVKIMVENHVQTRKICCGALGSSEYRYSSFEHHKITVDTIF